VVSKKIQKKYLPEFVKQEKATNKGQHEFTLVTKALRPWLMGFAMVMVSSEKEVP
jgi:hypothetical protein